MFGFQNIGHTFYVLIYVQKSCISADAGEDWWAFGCAVVKHQEQNYKAVFLLSEKTLPPSYCPDPITSVWDWALLSEDIVLIYINLLIQSFEHALFNCTHRQCLLVIGTEKSWKNHDGVGFDRNIYTACQILIHEIRNSTDFPPCDAVLRLHWTAEF